MADSEAYLEALPDAVVVVDAEGRIAYANAAAERLARAGRDELAGRQLDDAVPLRDGAGNPWWACTERLRRLPGVRRVPVRELHLVTEGEPVPVDLTASFQRDAAGRVVQAVCQVRDAWPAPAATASAADHLHPRPQAALAADQRQGLHLDPAAPLGSLQRQQKREMLATVNMDADRVTRLIGELLDVSRIDAGRLELRRTEFDLAAMAEGIVGRFELQHDRHSFRLSFPDGFPRVYADPDKIEQVLTNLVENAVKYSDGGPVTVTGQVTDAGVEVAVRDQGVGVATDQLPLIFTKFYRRPGHGVPSGTGLGLFIARGLVEAHAGRIWADSAPGQGTTLRFRLPRGGLELAGIT